MFNERFGKSKEQGKSDDQATHAHETKLKPPQLSNFTSHSLLTTATNLSQEEIRQISEHLERIKEMLKAEVKSKENEEKKEGEEWNEENQKEKEKETEIVEIEETEKEKKKEKDIEKIIEEGKEYLKEVEEIAKRIEKNLEEENLILERINEEKMIIEELGIASFLEQVEESIRKISDNANGETEEKEKEKIASSINEIEEIVNEKIEVLDELKEKIEENLKNGEGVQGLLKDIEEIAKKDKGELVKEIEELINEIKEIMEQEENPKKAREKVIELIEDLLSKHSHEIEILNELRLIKKNFDRLSLEEIKKELKKISKKIKDMINLLRDKARKLEEIILTESKNPERIGEAVSEIFAKEMGKEAKFNEMQQRVEKIWKRTIIKFIKRKIVDAEAVKDEKERNRWNEINKKVGEWEGSSLTEFNRRLSRLLERKEYKAAIYIANYNIVYYLKEIANRLERGRFVEELDDIIELDKKKDMKDPLYRMVNRLEKLVMKIEGILSLARDGKYVEMLEEIKKSEEVDSTDNFMLGCIGKVLVKIRKRTENSSKQKLIREYLKILNNTSMILKSSIEIKEAINKHDYKRVDEISKEIMGYIKTLEITKKNIKSILRNKKRKNEEMKKMIASILTRNIIADHYPKNYRKETIAIYYKSGYS